MQLNDIIEASIRNRMPALEQAIQGNNALLRRMIAMQEESEAKEVARRAALTPLERAHEDFLARVSVLRSRFDDALAVLRGDKYAVSDDEDY
jgi:hypothetical protein